MSYSDEETEKRLDKLERKIKKEYYKAYLEMSKEADEYFDKLEERYQQEYEAYQQGAYTDEQFRLWYQTQVMRGQGYEVMRDKLAQRMADANKVASAYVNDTTPGIYSLNANYSAYEINQLTGVDFHMVNEQAVRRLMEEENHVAFKVLSPNPQRNYEWNSKLINSELISGILQGKSIDELADGFLNVMKRNQYAAIRNARTAVTSAQNGGKNDTFKRAEDMGIEVIKEWVATLDSRTRTSHQHLDGQRAKIGDKFANGCEYPGDPDGEPAEVYNCRCVIKSILPKYNGKRTRVTYDEWKVNKFPKASIKSKKNDYIFEALGVSKGAARSISVALKDTNPLYYQDEEYQENCQRTVQTYELRRRGYEVYSQGMLSGDNEMWGNEIFVDKNGNKPEFSFNKKKYEIFNEIKSGSKDARYIIYGVWENSDLAHVFTVERCNGKLHIIDPQSGSSDYSGAFNLMEDGKFGILRVDDKKITSDLSVIREVCCNEY